MAEAAILVREMDEVFEAKIAVGERCVARAPKIFCFSARDSLTAWSIYSQLHFGRTAEQTLTNFDSHIASCKTLDSSRRRYAGHDIACFLSRESSFRDILFQEFGCTIACGEPQN